MYATEENLLLNRSDKRALQDRRNKRVLSDRLTADCVFASVKVKRAEQE